MIPLVLPAPKMGRPSKYRNKRVLGGFSSVREGKRAAELQLMQKAGLIRGLIDQSYPAEQVKELHFILIPAQYDEFGKHLERACVYICDFLYFEPPRGGIGPWVRVIEDSKGFRTPDYKIKRKLLLHVHGIRIRET